MSLTEFVHDGPNVNRSPVATVYTDSRGEYRFHPAMVNSTFALVRRGSEVTGRVVDEDGQPVPDIKVVVQSATLGFSNNIWETDAPAVSVADGTFTAKDVLPGPYVVRILPRSNGQPKVVAQFYTDDFEKVDQDFETSYWPGGTAQPSASIRVGPGGSANVGTSIRAR